VTGRKAARAKACRLWQPPITVNRKRLPERLLLRRNSISTE
jgi:hypothetical protein